ncbi:hypothetical protein HELRODRAFT_161002 [Helobdella robusta]|uniref:Cyclic nucleotide-binding domain-containing protein n=1 Tax=Helobdella robusta TaxID=6412 RepID=T1EQZ7_HELRO|nr:hypothetical protein HELRODRAFT_161002 [Helobdella robusta]ESO01831.1 hypothetical protein HELRODRAFT_161002 [Helobdella robusta]
MSLFNQLSYFYNFLFVDLSVLYSQYVSSSLAIAFATIMLTFFYLYLRKKAATSPQVAANFSKLRFRKREKFLFYGRKMLRRVKLFAKPIQMDMAKETGRRMKDTKKKRIKTVLNLAKRFLHFKHEKEMEWKAREDHPSLLEVDCQEHEQQHQLPPELMYMLRNVRVLGHFEKPIFLELCRFIESINVPAHNYLFQIGDLDDSIFVVQSGKIVVHVTEQEVIE